MNAIYDFKVQNDEFHGKRVLVTGGSRGIGAALVRRFHMDGARVAATGRTPPPDGSNRSSFRRT
jgi:NAD(P)-dependent dehydrogenase (short-subunit alcohol dehydrogenase family)